ncbi:MAG: phosphohydrolase [Rubritepida sp.]|nr:phosphohydrolase [Rubritepida sp.]
MTDDREYPDRPWVGIGVVLFRGEQVLLVQRGKPPRVGSWSLPGGAQHLGETTQQAARRELLEETGLEAGPLILADVIDAVSLDAGGKARYHYTIIDYCGHWAAGEALAGDDVSAVAWAVPAELAGYELTQAALDVIELSRKRLAETGS